MNAKIVRTTAALATVVAAALLASCTAAAEPESSGDQVLEVWSRGGPEGDATYGRIFDAFTEKTGIEVDYTAVAEFDTQLQARAGQRDLPDVFINDAGSLGNYVAQGLVLPVDRESIAGDEEVADETWEDTTGVDGETYAVPFSRQANVTIIRKDWREALGIAIPTTWDELAALANAFATQDPDGNGVADTYGMVVPGTAENGYIARWGIPYVWQAGGELLEEGDDGTFTSVVDSPETKAGMEFIRDQFCTPGNVVPGSINFATADTPFFQEGTAGIYLTGGYNFNLFDENVGRENVEAIPMPAGPDGSTTFSEGENIYLGASSTNTEGQIALAEYLISAEAQETGMDSPAAGGDGPFYSVVRMPVNTTIDVGEVYGDDRWQTIADAYADDSEHFPWNIDFIPLRQVLADGMNAIMADCDSDIDALLATIDEGFESELSLQGLAP